MKKIVQEWQLLLIGVAALLLATYHVGKEKEQAARGKECALLTVAEGYPPEEAREAQVAASEAVLAP